MPDSKLLFLTRHAKSSWADTGLADKQRPLNKRGLRDAPRMGEFLAAQRILPQLVVSSPALRAFTTAKMLAEKVGINSKDIVIDDTIYMAYPEDLLKLIREFDNQTDRIMLVGHNPTMTELVNQLTGSDLDNVPTCGIAVIRIETDSWQQAGTVKANLEKFVYPKMLA